MRVRKESKDRGGLALWLAAVVWLWASLTAWGQQQSGGGSSLGLRAGESLPQEKIEEIYRKILADWSAGETERAPDELIELESTLIVDGDLKTRKTVFQAEQAVVLQVGAADIEVLVPIAVLHHEAYRRMLERGAVGRAMAMGHTRKMARDLAVRYWEQSGSEGASLVSSRLLTSLGGMLQKSAQQLPAAELYQQAIELDAKNITALVALATIYEKNAQAESAVKYLRQALAAEPVNSEALLRLALNLRRLPQDDSASEARKILEQLTSSTVPSWVTPLAFEELARLHADKEKFEDAESVLRQGMERFPADTRLPVQLASVLDRRGKPGEATDLVEKILAAPPRNEVSARFLYNTVRPELFEPSRRFLAENSQSRLPVLAQALTAPSPTASVTGVGR
jgi:tetratricopeptide (TPR) repeat protein